MNRPLEKWIDHFIHNDASVRKNQDGRGSGGWNGRQMARGAGIFLAAFALLTSFYTVQPDEEAVVLRFGAYSHTAQPGLNFKFPFGVDQVTKLKSRLILQQEFGFRSAAKSGDIRARDLDAERSMLTGDLNVADVQWITQFQIADPKKYLFSTAEPVANVRDISETIMRRVVGDRSVNEVLTVGRMEIADEARRLIQEVLDRYDMGLRIVAVKLQDVTPPESVRPSFNDVNAAKQEQEQAINQAEREYNKLIPEARGKAQKEISAAQGYAAALINRTEADILRFDRLVGEYQQNPSIVRDKIYIEAMERIKGKVDGVTIVDGDLKGLLPIFDGGKTLTTPAH